MLQRLDRFRGIVLHALEDDQAVFRGLHHIPKHLEPVSLAQAMRLQLILNQELCALLQILQDFADTDAPQPLARLSRLSNAVLHHKAGEEMRFPRCAAAPSALICKRLKKRLEYL